MEKISTDEKRLEILDAAMRLFSERGFERTTVDEIATLANVGKGTIYLYFENKEPDLFCGDRDRVIGDQPDYLGKALG